MKKIFFVVLVVPTVGQWNIIVSPATLNLHLMVLHGRGVVIVAYMRMSGLEMKTIATSVFARQATTATFVNIKINESFLSCV
jgi:hypothetical protein